MIAHLNQTSETATFIPHRCRNWTAIAVFLLALGFGLPQAQAATPTAVVTFESIGIYWDPGSGGSTSNEVAVRYREASGGGAWTTGHPLSWIGGEYRGSVVEVNPDTEYEIELTMQSSPGTQEVFTATTWSENFPVGNTTVLPSSSSSTLQINSGGSPSGYHLYTHAPGGSAEIDVQGAGNCIVVNADYVIIRGLDIKGSSGDCITVSSNVTNTVIEGNTISGWGGDTYGSANYDRAISLDGSGIGRAVIQRNTFKDPNADSVSWCERPAHPQGVYVIRMKGGGNLGNHVIRYNTMTVTNGNANGDGGGNWFHDAISATEAGADDTDIYGNYIEYVWDNGLEIEGSDVNVRVWGNRFNHVYRPIASAGSVVGPGYIWRNVLGPNARSGPESCTGNSDQDVSNAGSHFTAGFKIKDADGLHVYHTTMLHAPPPPGMSLPLRFIDGQDMSSGSNTRARNNILNVHNTAVKSGGDWDYDLYEGSVSGSAESNGIEAQAQYASSNGPDEFYLSSGSPGVDDGQYVPGFSNGFAGSAPDMGAFELGKAPLEFGVGAYTNSVCGNGVVEGGESCDGSNLDGASCQSLGFFGGSLSCSSCSFNTNGCTGDDTAPSVPQGLNATTAGQTQIDLSWSASNDPETGVSSYNIFRDGSSVGQAGSTSFSDTGLSSGTSYTYRVSAVNGAGLESAQSGAVTQSTGSPAPDTTPPRITSVIAMNSTTVIVVFDEPVGTGGATNASNYSINNGVAISSASLGSDLVTVTLSTSTMNSGAYTLTVNNVADLSSNPIASNTTVNFTGASSAPPVPPSSLRLD